MKITANHQYWFRRRILKLSAQEEEKVVTTRNVVTQMYHELAKKTIEKVDKFEGQVSGLSHDVEELKHDNSMRGDNHLATTWSCVQPSPHIANSKVTVISGVWEVVLSSDPLYMRIVC